MVGVKIRSISHVQLKSVPKQAFQLLDIIPLSPKLTTTSSSSQPSFGVLPSLQLAGDFAAVSVVVVRFGTRVREVWSAPTAGGRLEQGQLRGVFRNYRA